MTRTRSAALIVPVIAGEFADGPDTAMWNPHLSRARYRWAEARAALPFTVVLGGLVGAGLVALGCSLIDGFTAVLAIGIGVLVLGSTAFIAWANFDSFTFDHMHKRGRRCYLEQCPGEYFYRTADFSALGAEVRDTVAALVDAVAQLHRSPSRAWLDPTSPDEAHRVAWEALCCLDRTRAARVLVRQLQADPAASELYAAVCDALAVIDRALGEVLTRLQNCVTLTRAWEVKLHHIDLRVRTEITLEALRDIQPSRLVAAAEPLPQNVFAYVTAARDVTGTGSFPWEAAASTSARSVAVGRRALPIAGRRGDALDRFA